MSFCPGAFGAQHAVVVVVIVVGVVVEIVVAIVVIVVVVVDVVVAFFRVGGTGRKTFAIALEGHRETLLGPLRAPIRFWKAVVKSCSTGKLGVSWPSQRCPEPKQDP